MSLNYEKYLGVPFKYGGQSIDEGFDCWNLCRVLSKEVGIDMPEYAYCQNPENSLIHQMIFQGKPLFEKLNQPEPYCLVLFKLHPPYATHLGFVTEDNCFMHIMAKRSVAKERLDHIYWAPKIEGFYRWRGCE